MKNSRFTKVAKALKSMAHSDRLKILAMLGCKKQCTVSCIQKGVGLTQSMTSQHLLAMKAQGILHSIKRKNEVFYSISNKEVLKVIKCMMSCSANE